MGCRWRSAWRKHSVALDGCGRLLLTLNLLASQKIRLAALRRFFSRCLPSSLKNTRSCCLKFLFSHWIMVLRLHQIGGKRP